MRLKIVLAAGLLIAVPAHAQSAADAGGIEAGDVLLRVRGIMVAPTEKSSGITPTFPAEQVSLDNSVMPEIDLTYMASDHIDFELIAATTKHSASGVTGTTGGIGKLASTWVLPPTLTAQYHFNPKGSFRPYVGAGVNYSVFWDEKASDGLVKAVGPTKVHMSDSVGWAAQAGIDIDVSPRAFLNLDVKYIDMDTDVRLSTTAIGTQRVHVDINPVVVGIGIGFRL